MNIRLIKERVARIKTMVDRKAYEAAHSEEDRLHQEVMTHAVTNRDLTAQEIRDLLRAALLTRDMQFDRYCG